MWKSFNDEKPKIDIPLRAIAETAAGEIETEYLRSKELVGVDRFNRVAKFIIVDLGGCEIGYDIMDDDFSKITHAVNVDDYLLTFEPLWWCELPS